MTWTKRLLVVVLVAICILDVCQSMVRELREPPEYWQATDGDLGP